MLLMDDIIKEGNPILHEKSIDVKLPLSEDDKKTLESMMEYLRNSNDPAMVEKYNLRPGVGLAAPQVGKNIKMLVIDCEDEQDVNHVYAMVNPKVISYSEELTYLPNGEGCLSVPRQVAGYVHRAKRITVETYLYVDETLVKTTLRLRGFLSIVFQHEYDHLNGILFTDRINKDNPFDVPKNSKPMKL